MTKRERVINYGFDLTKQAMSESQMNFVRNAVYTSNENESSNFWDLLWNLLDYTLYRYQNNDAFMNVKTCKPVSWSDAFRIMLNEITSVTLKISDVNHIIDQMFHKSNEMNLEKLNQEPIDLDYLYTYEKANKEA